MGVIKINNIIYGSNNSADIIYKDITVEEKLDTIPIFDINDNGNVVLESDMLTYGHIINTLDSDATDKVLSAKQGKILNEKFDNIDFSALESDINLNKESIDLLNNKINNEINNEINILSKTIDENINTLDIKINNNHNNIININNNIVKYNIETDCLDIYMDGVLIGSKAMGFTNPIALVPVLTASNQRILHSGEYTAGGYPAWKLFNGTATEKTDSWVKINVTAGKEYVGYNFEEYKTVSHFFVKNRFGDTNGSLAPTSFKLQGSDNLNEWYDIQTYSHSSSDSLEKYYYLNTPRRFKAFRLLLMSFSNASTGVGLCRLQFYGY